MATINSLLGLLKMQCSKCGNNLHKTSSHEIGICDDCLLPYRNLKMVGDICELIYQNLNSDCEAIRDHSQTLLGPRKHGNTTKCPLSYVNKNTPIELFPTPIVKGDAVCFQFNAPELGGMLGALPLLDVQILGYTHQIVERVGLHSHKELFCPIGAIHRQEANKISVIVGQTGDDKELVVFTWHPGNPLMLYEGGFPDFERIDPMTAVKLV